MESNMDSPLVLQLYCSAWDGLHMKRDNVDLKNYAI